MRISQLKTHTNLKKINASRQKWILPPKNPWVGSFYRTQPGLFATLNGEGC